MSALQSSPSRKLTARLNGSPDLDRSSLWMLDGKGRPHRVTDREGPVPVDLANGWEGYGLVSGGRTVWVAATKIGRNRVFRLEDGDVRWRPVLELAAQAMIVAGADGSVWQLGTGALTKLHPVEQALELPFDFQAEHASFGGDGTAWAIGGLRRFGGTSVWRYASATARWIQLPPPAAAVRIAGGPDGTAWSLNNRGDVWRLHPEGAGSFRECGLNRDCTNCLYSDGTGSISDLAVDDAGTVWWARTAGGDLVQVEVVIDLATKRTRKVGVVDGARAIAAMAN